MNPEIEQAIEEIKQTFPGVNVHTEPDGQGGAFVRLEPMALRTGKFNLATTWIAFQITFQYPLSDVYPHFVDPELRLASGQQDSSPPLGDATSMGVYRDQPAIQLSRKSPRRDPNLETAAIKLLKVLQWLNRE